MPATLAPRGSSPTVRPAHVHYRVQIALDGVMLTSGPYLNPADAVIKARVLSLRADDHEAAIHDERGRIMALFGWTGLGDAATPKVAATHFARPDADLVEALSAQDATCFGEAQ